ncbi:MAG: hypothetical protein HQK54_04570 [Oligoflexales bacterium]|nr:hypothetical protein [Oligoflexales bacterium]
MSNLVLQRLLLFILLLDITLFGQNRQENLCVEENAKDTHEFLEEHKEVASILGSKVLSRFKKTRLLVVYNKTNLNPKNSKKKLSYPFSIKSTDDQLTFRMLKRDNGIGRPLIS